MYINMCKMRANLCLLIVSSSDFRESNTQLQFNSGESRVCYNIIIIDDDICEGSENFFASIAVMSGESITITIPLTEVRIEDEMESECGQFIYTYIHVCTYVSIFILYIVYISDYCKPRKECF